MFDLSGKVALVTGGSRGIGRGIAIKLAAQGARVVITYINGSEAARKVVAEIEAAGGKAEADQFDVGNFDAADQAVAEIAKRAGGLDILVANAGISIDSLLLRLREEDLDRTLAVNVKGAIACARAAIKPMIRAKAGRLIFLSSVVGERGNPGQTAYCASKAALLGVTKALAREYASRNITANAITPGYISTDMTGDLNEDQQKAMLAAVPLARPGSVDDIAAAVVYLASNEASYVTGQTLRVNGGMYM